MGTESDSLPSMKSLGSISVLESEKLGEHYMQRLQESDGDITRTVDLFFRDHWPKKNLCDDESRNLKAFLTYVGYRNRLMTKMSKIGTGVKIALSLFLGQSTGMGIYAATAVGACLGLLIFMMNCDENFEKALFWRPKSGTQHVLDSCQSKTIRKTFCKTKDDEIWLLWVESVHPAYLPFDFITKWICEDLVDKYTGMNNLEERPEWMIGDKEALFLKRIVTIYTWYGNEADLRAVNEAIFKLTGKSGDDMKPKPGIKGMMTFIKPDEGSTEKVATPKGIKSRIMARTPVRIEPEPEPEPEPEIDV
ncbi:hypothetical protein TrST_g10770 [Triparma strigata]|uniref:Uncharacterized protein n=1 Tax=Triparma strigata TaxID=1606541 RepID=A0A9W7C4G9_9STRA|nr:hypothetical protein TrST_g10770 [Triparma strigata]